MAQYKFDNVLWPAVPIYNGKITYCSKVELLYDGAGTYQFNNQNWTFLGKKCKDGFIHLLGKENEEAIFTQKFDYVKTNVSFHVIGKKSQSPYLAM